MMPPLTRLCAFVAFVGLMLTSSVSVAQGAHYWTRQYGAKSTLLSNSVIGSVGDLGAVFYNPGRLGLIENPTFILSADVYEYSRVQFKDIPGNDVSIATSDLGSVPGFVAGTFRIKKLPKHKFAYSALTRQLNDVNIRYSEQFATDAIPEIPGDEDVSSKVLLNEKLRQQWYSVSWAFSPGEGWGIGATLSGVRYKSQKLAEISVRALTGAGDIGSFDYERFYNFARYGFLMKFGVAKSHRNLSWGATLTTPMLGLFGTGEFDFEEVYVPIDTDPNDFFAVTQQKKLKATYKLPWALGAGISFKIPNGEIHFSSEWFSAIREYTILNSEDFVAQSGNDTLVLRVVDDLRSVINFGIGAEYHLKEDLSLFVSASTDFSSVKDDGEYLSTDIVFRNSSFGSNLYHIATGVVFQIANSDITIGCTYTGASQPVERLAGLPGDDGTPVFDSENPASYRWTRVQLVVGFSLSLFQN